MIPFELRTRRSTISLKYEQKSFLQILARFLEGLALRIHARDLFDPSNEPILGLLVYGRKLIFGGHAPILSADKIQST